MLLIPYDIINNSIRNGVDKVQWYIHCGDHIMARKPITDSYTVIHKFNAYNINEVRCYSKIVSLHNENLLIGMSDTEYNKSLDKIIYPIF